MKFHRIKALVIRQLYIYPRSFPRILDVFFWPVLQLLVWGFLSVYLEHLNLNNLNFVSVLLGAVIFWEFLDRSQQAVTIGFLEDLWEKNLLNIFVSPLRVIEFLASTVSLGFIRIIIQGVVLGVISFLLYHFNLFQFGLYTIPFMLSLLLFGWILGLFVTGIILRFGSNAQVLAFGAVFLIQPFSAVFYPLSALPTALQYVARIFPSTYIFEGMRAVIATGTVPLSDLIISFGLDGIYLVAVIWFFYKMFNKVKEKGLLLKLES